MIIAIVFAILSIANWWSNLVEESNKESAIRIEQSKKM